MKRAYKKTLVILGIVSGTLFVLWLAIGLLLMSAEGYGLTPGSFHYWIGIPRYVKDIPIIMPCDTPSYSYEAMDVSPGGGTIEYNSYAPQAEIEAYYRRFLISKGCKITMSSIGLYGEVCANNDFQQMSVVVTTVEVKDQCTTITIDTID